MANNYTKASFELEAQCAELDLLEEAFRAARAISEESDIEVSVGFASAFPAPDDDPLLGFRDCLGDESGDDLGIDIERDEPGRMSIYGETGVSVHTVGELIRRCCPSALPFAFTYSTDCDRPIANSFSGGYVLVEASGVSGESSDMTAYDMMLTAGSKEPLSETQKMALEAYDDDGRIRSLIDGMSAQQAVAFAKSTEMGDTLAAFLLIEVSDASTAAEAAEMLRSACRQLESVADALDAAEDAG